MSFPNWGQHMLREKGLRYAYNYLQYQTFYNTRSPALVKLLKRLQPYPFYLEIENTTFCNLRCRMCEHTYWDERPRSLTFEQFEAVVNQFPRLKWIGLTGIGESYLNKDFSRMLRGCKERRLIVELFDTFFFVDAARAAELVELGIEQIYCSLDAATRETYEAIRVGSNFDRVVENVRRFVELKRRAGTFFPVLDFHFIISKLNIHELEQYVDLIADIAPGSIVQFTRLLHKYPAIEEHFVDVPEARVAAVQRRANARGVRVTWNMNLSRNKPLMRDCVTWYMPFIFSTGEVIPCCSGNEANGRDRQKATSLGNVFDTPFKEIWWGEKYQTLRGQLRRGERPAACRDCSLYSHEGGEVQ